MKKTNPNLRRIIAVLIAMMLLVTSVVTVYGEGTTEHTCSQPSLRHKKVSASQHETYCIADHCKFKVLNDHTFNKAGKCGGCYYECEHGDTEYTKITEARHTPTCKYCGKTYASQKHVYNDGVCVCGAKETPKHECNYETVTTNNNGTHNISCECGKYVTAKCSDNSGDGKCDSCGYQKYVAPEGDHEHNYVAHSNNDGTHNLSCNCGLETKNVTCLDNNGDGKCDSCGYQKYVAPEGDHEHNYVAHPNDDDTHTSSCNCGLEVTMACYDADGDDFCDACGDLIRAFHKCTFEAGVTSNEDGTHNINCKCGAFVTVTCLDNDGDRFCDSCGYEKYAPVEGEHEHNYVAHSNNDGTHNLSCNCGLEVKNVTCLDNDGDRYCDSCGYEKYAPVEDNHEHNYVAHSNNDGTHNLSCNCGKEVKNVTCLDSDGDRYCDSCGYEKYAPVEGEHEHNYVAHSNDNGTHNLSCNCGLEVKNITCLDNDGDRFCDSCGYEKYLPVVEDHEHNYVAHSNNDGTHNLSCNCGLEVKNVTCLDNDGDRFCDSCGYEKYLPVVDPEDPTVDPEDPTVDPEDPTVDPEDPTVDPEDPAEDDSDETEKDSEEKTTDVPKTGDSRSSMMMTLLAASIVLMGAAMVTAAAYFKAGKNRR